MAHLVNNILGAVFNHPRRLTAAAKRQAKKGRGGREKARPDTRRLGLPLPLLAARVQADHTIASRPA
jgi:hypothetical protein